MYLLFCLEDLKGTYKQNVLLLFCKNLWSAQQIILPLTLLYKLLSKKDNNNFKKLKIVEKGFLTKHQMSFMLILIWFNLLASWL